MIGPTELMYRWHRWLRDGIAFADLDGFFDGDLLTREDVREAYGEVLPKLRSVQRRSPVRGLDATRRGRRHLPSDLGTKGGSHDEQAWFQRYRASAEGKTDWARVRAMKDVDIQFNGHAPRTSAQDRADAVAHRGLPLPTRKEQIPLRVDADVLAWYRAQGTAGKRA